MVISDAEKKVLLERLEKARIAKQAKAAEAKKAKEAAKESPVLAPAPTPAPVQTPTPVLEPVPTPAHEEQAQDPIPPPIPDLVKASRKPAKKVALPDSDDSEEEVIMPKKSKGKSVSKKEVPYMKIKLYKEPSNPVAFQQMLESINDPQYEEEEEQVTPPPPPIVKGPRVLQKVGIAPKRGSPSSLTLEDIKAAEMRKLALEIFG